jgi:hypothetical protein
MSRNGVTRTVKKKRAKPDPTYESAVNSFITRANAYANDCIGKFAPRGSLVGGAVYEKWAMDWNREFHQMMDALTLEAGLRKLAYQDEE